MFSMKILEIRRKFLTPKATDHFIEIHIISIYYAILPADEALPPIRKK
jgi:hypothetical protein